MRTDQDIQTPPSAANPYRETLAGLRPVLLAVLGFSAVVNVLMLTGSIYMLQVYDRVLSSGSVATLVGLFAIVVVLYGFLGLYDALRTRLLSRAGLRLDAGVGTPTFQRWLRSGVPGGATGPAASAPRDGLWAHGLRDLDTLRGFLSSSAPAALSDVPFVPLFLGVLFLIHPWLGLMTVAGAVIGVLIALLTRFMTKEALRQGTALDTHARDFAAHSRRNAEVVVAMGMQEAIGARWQALHRAVLHNGQTAAEPSDTLAAISRSFRMLLQSAILTLGALLVLRGEISPGMIIAGSILSGRALAPVDQLIGQWRTIGKAAAAHRRLVSLFEAARPDPVRIDLPDPTGQISVTGLTKLGASRPGAEPVRILSRVSFALEPGDGLGIIGKSASGKSTLARLLVGGGQPDEGEIRFDGATPDQWDPIRLGRRIGYLPQILEMLPGTIRDNLARFDPLVTDETIIAAAQLTGVHEMILKLPEGYATRLGDPEMAPVLSGGQMQRLGLARAVCGMPAIVVLDEPNSNLDQAGEAALTRTIEALRAARSTVIVIAHRPSALMAVNKLLLLDTGIVRGFGDKDEVLAMSHKPKPAKTVPAAAALATTVPIAPVRSAPVPAAPAAAPAAASVPARAASPVSATIVSGPRPAKQPPNGLAADLGPEPGGSTAGPVPLRPVRSSILRSVGPVHKRRSA
jgi:ATP-binding cassette, subfamily C, bacterial exporter for protease/lipase